MRNVTMCVYELQLADAEDFVKLQRGRSNWSITYSRHTVGEIGDYMYTAMSVYACTSEKEVLWKANLTGSHV